MNARNGEGNATIRWVRRILVLALATLALATLGGEPAIAAPVDTVSRDQLRSDCQLAGGAFWETASGYGCRLGGLTIECDAAGNCTNWCYEARGCRCDVHGDDVICVHGFTPDGSSNPWDDIVQVDPYQEAKLPDRSGPETPYPGTEMSPDSIIVSDDPVTKGLESSAEPGDAEGVDPSQTIIETAPGSPALTTPISAAR